MVQAAFKNLVYVRLGKAIGKRCSCCQGPQRSGAHPPGGFHPRLFGAMLQVAVAQLSEIRLQGRHSACWAVREGEYHLCAAGAALLPDWGLIVD